MAKSLRNLFLGASLPSAVSSALNLVVTIVTVRWFGAEVYANYIVDLAILSIGMILLEIVPSNYSVFRIQDDPSWKSCVAAQLVVTMIIASLVVVVAGNYSSLFRSYTGWIAVYAVALAAKRYLDIRLQSSGKLSEFMGVEAVNSALRLGFLGGFFFAGIRSSSAVWGALAIAATLSQAAWWLRNRVEIASVSGFLDRQVWIQLWKSYPSYTPYYYGIALKRLKDNVVPLVAEALFTSRESLATFFLAYRGVIFAAGQVRIIESLMNHRATLLRVVSMSGRQKALVAFAAQLGCVAVSGVLLLTSGIKQLPWPQTAVLSFMMWPIAYQVLERSKAYSDFRAHAVNLAILGYVISVVAMSSALFFFGASSTVFSVILVLSEMGSLALIWRANEKYDHERT